MGFSSEGGGERLGSTPNAAWARGRLEPSRWAGGGVYSQGVGWESVGGKLLRGNLRGMGDSG